LIVGILAGKFHTLSKPAFIVNFALLQFFFNFGANTTTYVRLFFLFPVLVVIYLKISATPPKSSQLATVLSPMVSLPLAVKPVLSYRPSPSIPSARRLALPPFSGVRFPFYPDIRA
jgi:hypothetical protein